MSLLFRLSGRIPQIVGTLGTFSTSIKTKKTTNLLNISQWKKSPRLYSTEVENKVVNTLKKRIAENKEKNVLVYSIAAKSSLFMNVTGIVAAVFLLGTSYNSFLIFDSVKFKSQRIEDDGSLKSYVFKMISSSSFKYSVCSVVALVGVGILATTCIFTMRSVNKMYLLKGGNSIGVITEGLFGKTMPYELALSETTFSSTRMKRSSLITFKSKNHYFYFIVNNLEGEFHEKELFDHVICSAR